MPISCSCLPLPRRQLIRWFCCLLPLVGGPLLAAPALAQRPPGVPALFPTLPAATAARPVSPYFTGYADAHLPTNPTPDEREIKSEESDYLARYGASDTAAALIHLYFRKRGAGHLIFAAAVVPLIVALTGRRYERVVGGPSSGQTIPVDKPYVEPFAYSALSLQFLGLIKTVAWNRRALYDELVRFGQTRRLSRSMNRRLRPHLIKTRNREYGD